MIQNVQQEQPVAGTISPPRSGSVGESVLPSLLHWDSELFVLRGHDREDLLLRIGSLSDFLERSPDVVLKDLAFTLNHDLAPQGSRLAIIAGSAAELKTRLKRARERLADPRCQHIKDGVGIYYFSEPLHPQGRVAVLFPGEGAQYLNMLGDLYPHFPEVRELVDNCEQDALRTGKEKRRLSRILCLSPEAAPEEKAEAEKVIRTLGGTMLSVLLADWAIFQCLRQLGLTADVMAGHSAGELAALWASGCLALDALVLEQTVGTLENLERQEEEGSTAEAVLLAVGAGRGTVAEIIQKAGPSVYLAMDNCPHQSVVAGPAAHHGGCRGRAATSANRVRTAAVPPALSYAAVRAASWSPRSDV